MADVRAPGRSPQGGGRPSELGRGSRLGRYELLAPIGVGGMAKVWAARQTGYSGFAKVVAIKTILPHLSRESDFERLFVDEARVASLVRHPNVCEIYELSEDGQVLFLVMEWVDGDSLIKMLKTGQQVVSIDPRVAARIAAETCAGLHAAHIQVDHDGSALNIVHRDVSPHNILLSAEGVVKVTDFGVAKAAGQTHDQTVAGQLKGKLEYMSPEQITGGRVDGRTDVFGIGAVIYEATTGIQPFASSGDLEVMNKIVEGRLVPPSQHFRQFPRELEAIVMRAMAVEPDNRFATADEMRVALENFIARSGPPVAHSEVAAVLRSRVGGKMDERLERIRAAMSTNPNSHPSHTPSGAGISTSGVIATGKGPPRIAPPPPAVPQPVIPSAYGPALDAPPPSSTADDLLVLDEDDAPDSSGFNMDTVADFQLPDFLNPNAGLARPPQQQGGFPPFGQQPPAAGYPAQQGFAGQSHAPQQQQQAGPQQPQLEAEPPLDLKQYIIAAAIGVGVAIVVGGGAYGAYRLLAPAPPPAPVKHAQSHTDVAPGKSSGGSTASPAQGSITFRVVPSSASLLVDGHPLASGGRTLPRVAVGHKATLTARAAGYEDETMVLDPSVRGTIDVVLTPKRPSPVAVNLP